MALYLPSADSPRVLDVTNNDIASVMIPGPVRLFFMASSCDGKKEMRLPASLKY